MVKLLRSSVELNSCIVVVFDRLNRSYLTLKSVDVKALPGGSNWTHGVSAKALRHEHPVTQRGLKPLEIHQLFLAIRRLQSVHC